MGFAQILEQLALPDERIESLNLASNHITLVQGARFESSQYAAAAVGVEDLVLDGNPFKRGGYLRMQNLVSMLVPLATFSLRDCLVDD